MTKVTVSSTILHYAITWWMVYRQEGFNHSSSYAGNFLHISVRKILAYYIFALDQLIQIQHLVTSTKITWISVRNINQANIILIKQIIFDLMVIFFIQGW